MARCPAHEDREPSLSIKDADGGKVLVRCHAGCDQQKVIPALKARGSDVPDAP
jgi:putative DNA primase/helicase